MKALADLAALLGADRDVLQVGIGGGEPAGGGGGQREGGVHPAGLRIDVAGQRIGVGALQLGELAPVEDHPRQRVALLGQILQHATRRWTRRRSWSCLPPGKPHLAEQDVADLLGAAEIERLAGERVGLGLEPRGALREIVGEARSSSGRSRCRAAPCRPAPGPAAAPASRRRWACPRRPAAA